MLRQKVFCVGFQKTGTTSLGMALSYLGYQVCGYYPFRDLARPGQFDENLFKRRLFEMAETHDAFKDTPWPVFYKELDERYPNSKFILIVRDTEKWIRSATQDFQDYENAIHNYIYGVPYPVGNEEIFINRYERHNREVQDYFSDRPDDLITLNLDKGEVNWNNICGFLGYHIPDKDWPHANTIRQKKVKLFLNKLRDKMVRIISAG
jgi:hypothetical protein